MSAHQSRRTSATAAPRQRSRTRASARQKPPRRRLTPAERRAELLTVALSVFARRGIGRATHAEVADAAGCSLATVFVYFPKREDLVSAVLDEVESFYTQMSLDEDVETPALDVLRGKIDAFTRSVETHDAHARVWLEWSTAIREDIWPRYVAFQEHLVRNIGAIVERGKLERSIPDADGDDAARLLIGGAHMLAQMKFSGQSDEKIARFVRTITTVAFGPKS